MTRQPSNIDKILDISSFTSSRGFIVSSSDEDDNVNELKKSSSTVQSKLSNLFATTSQKASKQGQNTTKRQPIFASSVGLFTAGESGELQNRGQVGIAVTDQNGKYILIIYNAAKQVIANFPLVPGSLEFSVRYGKDSYLHLSAPSASVTLHFDESKNRSGLHILASLLVLLCELEEFLLYSGEGEPCYPGCHVLFQERKISLEEGELHVDERPQEKKKLSQTIPLVGLGKGGIRILRTDSSASIVTIVKIKYPQDNAKVESETSSLVAVDSPQVADLSEIEAEVQLTNEKTNDIMSRIVKVGQAIVPLPPQVEPSPTEEEKELATTSRREEPSTCPPPAVETPVPIPREYPVFHKVVGTEIDRLEIRLEASVQRMIDRVLEPLREDMRQLMLNQVKILDELQDLRKMKD